MNLRYLFLVHTMSAIVIMLACDVGAVGQEAIDADAALVDTDDSQREPTVSVDSPQGTSIGDYVAKLKQSVKGLNIIVADSVSDYQLPEIKLDRVPAPAAVYCLEQISNGEFRIESDNWGSSIIYIKPNPQYQKEITIHVMNVEQLLKHKDEKQLLTAVEIGLEMLNTTASKVNLKLHSESSLLFARGVLKEVELIDNIVNEMRKGIDSQQTRGGGRGGGAAGAGPLGGGRVSPRTNRPKESGRRPGGVAKPEGGGGN